MVAHKTDNIEAIGIAWYRREDWSRAMAVFSDKLLLPSSYDNWLNSVNHLEEAIRQRGALPVKAYINPVTFPAWCKKRGLKPDAQARVQYASHVASKRAKTSA